MAMNALRYFAAAAPARVFVAPGEGADDKLETLVLDPRVEIVRSPRHATILLMVGQVPKRAQDALRLVHDQIPHPRAAARWGGPALAAIPDAVAISAHDDPGFRIAELARDVIIGRHPSSDALLPDEPPAPWRGCGDHGQGGEGMMGGKPYGRPMAMTDDDLRDGLALDRMPLRLGPFLPALPSGLILELALQGDVILHASVEEPPFVAKIPDCFRLVRRQPVAVSELERARARHHLRRVAAVLDFLGMDSAALRTRRVAASPDAAASIRLEKVIRRSGALLSIPPRCGVLDGETAVHWGGPTARAAGSKEDARLECDVYRDLAFEICVESGSDVRARVRQRLAEARQSLVLAARADEQNAHVGPLESVEGPEGTIGPKEAALRAGDRFNEVGKLLTGQEWGNALLTLASFDLRPTPREDESS